MSLEKVHTLENATDMLTKPVPKVKFKHCLVFVACDSAMGYGGGDRGVSS